MHGFNFRINYLLRQNIRSLILTSGTLAPLETLISEMDIPDPIKLTNPHIIDRSQVLVKVVDSGADAEKFDTSFRNR